MVGNLSTIISTGLNNPDCAFYTGAFIGQAMTFRFVVLLGGVYIVVKLIDKLALNPLINFIKKTAIKNWRRR